MGLTVVDASKPNKTTNKTKIGAAFEQQGLFLVITLLVHSTYAQRVFTAWKSLWARSHLFVFEEQIHRQACLPFAWWISSLVSWFHSHHFNLRHCQRSSRRMRLRDAHLASLEPSNRLYFKLKLLVKNINFDFDLRKDEINSKSRSNWSANHQFDPSISCELNNTARCTKRSTSSIKTTF